MRNAPDADLIKKLELLLKQARSGELEGFAAALLFDDSRVGITIAGEAWKAPATTIGLLWQCQHTIHTRFDRNTPSDTPAPTTPA